jgi:NADPH-dependent ferric siderophore reductase
MIRIVAEGPELAGFVSGAPDDHIKVFVEGEPGERIMRDYTPRHHDADAGTLTIDFFDHEGGPVSDWARGQSGRCHPHRRPARFAGDRRPDRALAAGGRRDRPARDRPPRGRTARRRARHGDRRRARCCRRTGLASAATLDTRWVHRSAAAATDPAPLLAALDGVDLVPGTFVWIAAEAGVARRLREHLVETRGLDKRWIKAAGYWVAGEADSSAKNLGED